MAVLLANKDLLTKYFAVQDRTQKELMWTDVREKIGESVSDYVVNFNLLVMNTNGYFDSCFYMAYLYKQLMIYDHVI